ncbi:MAG: energy transducer TonB [Pyrinomonadaceae bacterium]
MPKALKRLALALLTATLCAQAAAAQGTPAVQTPALTPPPEWVNVSPAGEAFTALMPKQPSAAEQKSVRAGGMEASGRRYTAGAGGATFTVWSLSDARGEGLRLSAAGVEGSGVGVESLYLDRVAQVAWQLIIAPELERLRSKFGISRDSREVILETGPVAIVYARDFELSGRPAREYHVSIERERGRVYVCADGARFYVVAAIGPKGGDPRLRSFPDSFSLGLKGSAGGSEPSAPLVLKAGSPEPPRADAGSGETTADAGGPSKHDDGMKRALITFKPDPGFTEEARWFNVAGVVRIRAILASDGQVKIVSVVKPLPHGLTRRALGAARLIKFEPARKDDRPVSQYVVFEYNFNIY